MRLATLAIVVCIGLLPLLGRAEGGVPGNPAATRFVATQFTQIESVEDLPEPVISSIRLRVSEPIVAIGAEFNPGDVVRGSIPQRRVILGGTSSSLAFIWYEHGGRGLHEHLLVFDRRGAEAPLLFHAQPRRTDVRTLPDLKRRLSVGEVVVETVPGGEY